MRKCSGIHIVLVIIFVGGSWIAARTQPQSQQKIPTFSVAVDLIKVPITIFDEHSGIIQDLRRDDFRLYEDGKPQQIRSFGMDTNPVSVVLLIDSSGTVEKELKQIKEAAGGFADALTGGDRTAVITFADEVEEVLDWTSNTKDVHKALRKIQLGLRTNLYDAMFQAAQDKLGGIEGRKAIILLTDFLNNQSVVGYQDAVRAIVQSQASLYIVSKTVMVREDARKQRRVVWLNEIYSRLFPDSNYIDEFFTKKEAEMTDLAEKTGGRCYFPSSYTQIRDVYKQVASELKNQYYITYVSDQTMTPNSYHRITVEYLQPSNKLVYRKGYYFKPDPLLKPRTTNRYK
jgi:Ca-activated chloride channel homolog